MSPTSIGLIRKWRRALVKREEAGEEMETEAMLEGSRSQRRDLAETAMPGC